MNRIVFNTTGGFPLTTNVLNELQKAYAIFNQLGFLLGNKVIVSGCDKVGNFVSDGYIFVDGELFFFKGGSQISTIRLVESISSKVFEDGVLKEVIYERYYEFGTGTTTLNWVDFSTFDNILQLIARLEELEKIVIPVSASQAEVDEGKNTTKYVTPATLPELESLFSGRVASNGSRIRYNKISFSSTKTATGSYKITHNLGHMNYGVSATGISTAGNIKTGLKNISTNYFELGLSDDASLNDAGFVFNVYKN